MEWNYGNAIDRCPIQPGEIWGTDLLRVQVHDIRNLPLPPFMREADCIFVDPPWNKGNVNSFFTKAGITERIEDYEQFSMQVITAIQEIYPDILYVEMGRQHLAFWKEQLEKLYPFVQVYNSSYYHRKTNVCFVIRCTRQFLEPAPIEGMDEEDIIKWVCKHEQYSVIGDPCMGRGLVGKHAVLNGRKAVGTELNPKRLAVLLETCKAKKLGDAVCML